MTFEEKFWSNYDIVGECWIWLGPFDKDGYGQIYYPQRKVATRTNIVAWELTNGFVPKGLCILHTCDNRPCIRPTHLFSGTNAQNTADMLARGRERRWYKFSDYDVEVMLAMREEGYLMREIATEFETSISYVCDILNGKRRDRCKRQRERAKAQSKTDR
jgi:hypothetical protein